MATHIKINTYENNNVHFDTHNNNYTLCGLETGGDEGLGMEMGVVVKSKVNCPECIGIFNFCSKIKKTEMI